LNFTDLFIWANGDSHTENRRFAVEDLVGTHQEISLLFLRNCKLFVAKTVRSTSQKRHNLVTQVIGGSGNQSSRRESDAGLMGVGTLGIKGAV
jgi:hypothetical protein